MRALGCTHECSTNSSPNTRRALCSGPAALHARAKSLMRRKEAVSGGGSKVQGTRHLLPESLRPMQELLALHPQLKLDAEGRPDVQHTPCNVLSEISEHSLAAAASINLGLSAVGSLMAYAAPECADRTISSDSVEALGWLFAELGATVALFIKLGTDCRRKANRPQ
jgi:hypothetical protein